jgi:RHS repeat-associated protein
MAPYKGKIRLTNTITKLVSSEDLRFRVAQIDENGDGEVIATNTLLDQVVSAATATAIDQVLENLEITADTKLLFDISSPKLGTVRSDRVAWAPEVRYVNICTRQRSGVDIDDPATFTPEDGQSADDYLNEEVCKDLTLEEQDMTDRDLPGAVPPEDGTPPVKLFIFKPTPVLNVYPFKRLKPMEAWVAPRAGTVRIVTHSHKLAETSSELHLKIQSTNELISQYTYSTDQVRQINQPPLSVIDVPVTEGQRLFFNIVSKDAISPETVTIPDPAGGEGNPTIDVPSVAWDHEILYVDSPHCYPDPSTNTEICETVDKKFTNNHYNYYQNNQYSSTIWTMHFDELCLATDRCVIVDCTGNRQPGAPISLAAASCQTTEYVPNPDPEQPPVLVHKQVTQAERAATGLDRSEYFVPAVNRDSLEWREDDRSPLFGFYRDWSYVVWNGNKTWNPALLVVPDTVPEPVDPMNPTDEELDRIQPPDFWQAKPFAFGSNRYPDVPLWSAGGFDYLSISETMPFRSGGNITPFIKVPAGAGIANLRKTKNEQTKTSLGVGPLGASKSQGPAKTELDLVDMNGDRYPDQVSNGSIVFNRGIGGGGFDTEANPVSMGIQGEGALRRTESKSVSLSFGAGSQITEVNSSGKQVKKKSSTPTIGTGYGSSRTVVELMDINGDGLPDRVYRDGANIIVRLNLGGNRFGAQENWTAGGWSVSDISRLGKLGSVSPNAVRATDTVSANISSGSGSLGVNGSRTIVDLADINGDGLPDLVMKEHGNDYLLVRINQGNSFGSEKKWYVPAWGATIGRGATATLYGGNDVLGYNEGWTLTGGINFTIHFKVTIAFIVLHIFIEPDANISTGQGSSSLALMDVNGDGMPDQVYRANASIGGAGSGEVRIKYNKVGKTNLLKTVKRPLGGKISLDYERKGNEVDDVNLIDMPHSQWVLTSVNLTDGRGSSYATTCDYGKGYYSRSEREFYGFDSVAETHAPGTPLKRVVTRTFDNHNYSLRNMARKSVTTDNNGNALARTINTFEEAPVKVMRGQGTGGILVPGAIFPKLFQTDTYFYAGSTSENSYSKSTAQKFIYDEYGNVTKFTDFADNGSADDTNADIGYWTIDNDDSYMSKPSSIVVTGQSSNDVYRDRSSEYESGTGNLKKLTMSIAQSGSNPAVWDMSYDPNNGNLTRITYPSGDPSFNKMNNVRYFVDYTYDPELASYAASITDAFGYASEAGYQYEYGLPKWQKDINGNYQVNVYDIFGRMAKVYGPCDTNSQNEPSGAPTLEFAYRAPALVPNDSDTDEVNDNYAGTPARAVTSNKASACSGQTPLPSQIIATATFVDGMKRVLQTQKDAEVNGQPVVIVSGQVVYDKLGRVKEQDQPAANASKAYDLVSSVTRKGTTQFFYDDFDRTIRVIAPDGATTQTFYRFEGLAGVGDNLFLTQVIDPMGRSKESYKDVRDRIHAVVEHNTVDGSGVNIVTRYAYDAIGQITRVTDVRNNITSVTYDRLGRRLTINNPDTGLTSYTYDGNGNVTTKETANLRTGGKLIKYQYEYNRLKEIEYPDSPHVVYEYGSPTDLADNQAGRIKKVTDESGEEERYYGRLGEVVKEKRRINAFNNPVSRTWYETRYVFDSFGRMREMTYPDGEVLQYTYDSGGLLYHAEGAKRANRYVYVDKLRYDEFGQRTRIEYGNGVYTTYTYDDATRRLINLYTVALDNKASRVIQNIDYNYDLVGNILYTDNIDVPFPPGGMQGGKTRQDYTYDDLYQLTTANGWFQSAANKKTTYVNNLYYDIIGNITNKVQTHLVVHGGDPLTDSSTNPRETNYDLNYQYMTGGSAKPHAVTETENKLYKYDDNGNMTDWISKVSGQNRHLNWNEENRVKSIQDQGSTVVFLYDDSGERAVKRGQMGESVYVNRFYSLKNGGLGSKHIFAGETRVVTKLEKDGGSLSTGIPGTPALTNSNGIYNGLARGNGNKRGINRRLPNPDGTYNTTNPPLEKFEFFYHGDHLGSSSFITDDAGAVYQHLEYFPYGETWVEEGGTGQMSMYRFTGKELDPETGLYYYGARYYDPVLSRWISADPIDRFNAQSPPTALNLYQYGLLNPLRLIDPTGREEEPGLLGKIADWYVAQKTKLVNAVGQKTREATEGIVSEGKYNEAAKQYEENGVEALPGYGQGAGERFGQAGEFLTEKAADIGETVAIEKGSGVFLAGISKIMPSLGRKLEYLFGRATGRSHNIERSQGMLKQLESIGLPDSPQSRDLLEKHFADVLSSPSSIAKTLDNGRVVRESLLMGPTGGLKVESVWEGNKLITMTLFGGGN